MRRAWIAATAIITACGADPGPSCFLDDVIARDLFGRTAVDCGHAQLGADDANLIAAHDCALAAANAQRAFIVRWEIMGIDSHVERAYLGVDAGAGWSVRWFIYDGSQGGTGPDSAPATATYQCASLDDVAFCHDRATSLCLSCASAYLVQSCSASP